MKIERIRADLEAVRPAVALVANPQVRNVRRELSSFDPVNAEAVVICIKNLNKTNCKLDPVDVSKMPVAYEKAAGLIAHVANCCFAEGVFVESEKCALQKPSLDREVMSNYRPISNLSFLS